MNLNNETVKLLEECLIGCKTAIDSMEIMLEEIDNQGLIKTINEYKDQHHNIHTKITTLLVNENEPDKQPTVMKQAMTYFTTKTKLLINQDNNQESAKIMMNGCNMGIQSLAKYLNQYPYANEKAIKITKDLIALEEDLMKDMEKYL